jgi:hypothetical protein
MMKTSIAILLATASPALAGGNDNTFGIGAEYQLSGLGGASLDYDGGKYHLGGFVGYDDPRGNNNAVFDIGGHFFGHIHSTQMSDFGLGASVGFRTVGNGAMTGRSSEVYIEPSFQIRLFIVANVALSFTGGVSIGVVDANEVAVGGQGIGGGFRFDPVNNIGAMGGVGVHYYFF